MIDSELSHSLPHTAENKRPYPVSRLCALLAGLLGAFALLGWILDVNWLQAGLSRGAAMNPIFAIAAILGTVALWDSPPENARLRKARLGGVAALTLILIPVIRLGELWFSWSLHIDRLLFAPGVAAGGTSVQLSASVALCLLLIGVALLLRRHPADGSQLLSRTLALFVGLIAALALFGYLVRLASPQITTGTGAGNPVNTVVVLLLISIGIGIRNPSHRSETPTDGADLALGRRVNLALIVAVAILLLTGGLSIWDATTSSEAATERHATYLRRESVAHLSSLMHQAETGALGYMLTANPDYLQPYQSALTEIDSSVSALHTLLVRSPQQQARLDQLAPIITTKLANLGAAIAERQKHPLVGSTDAAGIEQDKRMMDQIDGKIAPMLQAEDSLVKSWDARLRTADRASAITSLFAGILAILFLGLAGIAINADFRKRAAAEATLKANEGRLAQIIELIPSMVFLKDAKELRFVAFNRAGEDLLGLKREAVIGKNDFDFFPADEATAFVAADRETMASDSVLDVPEETIHSVTLGTRILHTRKVAVRDSHGRPQYLLGISQDITERKHAEELLREAKQVAEVANQAKSGFLAKMSHELRTPLNSIIGFSEILEDGTVGPLNEKQQRYVGNVLTSGRNLLQLINDILDLSKVEAGRMELSHEEVIPSAAVEEVFATLSTLAEKKGIALGTEIPDGVPAIWVDPGRFRQVLLNLIVNAIKFTPQGGRVRVKVRIVPAIDETERQLEIAIEDTGIGIAPENLQRIFNEFEQVDSASDQSHVGTGLGLALTRRLVELHSGQITVESQIGRGSTFRVTLPLPEQSHLVPFAVAPGEPTELSPLVLVIDDEPHARDLMAYYLNAAGYRVVTTACGHDAVTLACDLHPAAITLDLLMPGRDGLQTLAELKGMAETRSIPIVVVSVSDRMELGFSLGAAEWFVKPIQRNALIALLERTIGPSTSTRPRTVLVIDDEPVALEYVSEILIQKSFRVLTASGGRLGIEMTLAERPDFIILDLMMPDVNGFEVVQSLRQHPASSQIPILILTAKELTPSEQQQLRSTVQGIVPKGGRDHLLAELDKICPPRKVATR